MLVPTYAPLPSPVSGTETTLTNNTLEPFELFEASDVDDPRTWSNRKKLLTVFGGILAAFTSVFGTSVYVASIPGVVREFSVSETLAISPVSFYALGQVVGPAITTSASELFGRRIILQISVVTALLFTIGAGCSQSFSTLVTLRFLASFAISPSASVALGMINDLWDISVSKTGTYVVLLAALANILPAALGLVVGAPVVASGGWRWTFWLTAILVAVALLTIIPIPETYSHEIARRYAKKHQTALPSRGNIKELLFVSFARPFHMLLVEPIILPTALVSATAQGIIFCYYAAYPVILKEVYSFNLREIGLAFLPILIGNLLAAPVLGVIDRMTYQKPRSEAMRSGTTVLPELRLYGAFLGGIGMPISLFWLAWTARKSIHWIVPLLSGILFGLSYTLILIVYAVYKNDIYGTKYGASAFAAEVMLRYLLSAAIPLFTLQMIKGIGFDWSMSLLGFVGVALIPVPWVLMRYGPSLRQRSRFVPHVHSTPGVMEDTY